MTTIGIIIIISIKTFVNTLEGDSTHAYLILKFYIFYDFKPIVIYTEVFYGFIPFFNKFFVNKGMNLWETNIVENAITGAIRLKPIDNFPNTFFILRSSRPL